MKTLPNLFKNENMTYKDNNRKNCVVKENIRDNNVLEVINNIFNSKGYPFDKKVIIKTKDKTYKTYLVTLYDDRVITLNDDVIKMDDIVSIERI